MHKLLQELLDRRKLKIDQLENDEKEVFDRWKDVLDEEMTVDRIAEYCKNQMELIEMKWGNLENKKVQNERLVMMHTVFGKVYRYINGKKTERRSVEEEISRLLDTE